MMQGDEGGPAGSDADLMTAAEDPVASYILKSIRGGVITSTFVLLVLVLYALLPGHGLENRNACLILILVGAALTAVSAVFPWHRVVGRRFDRALIYGWAFGLLALIDTGIAISGGARSQLFIVLVVLMVFLGGPYYSIRSGIILNLVAIGGYVITLAATGWGINSATLAFRIGMMASAALAVGILSPRAHDRTQSCQRGATGVRAAGGAMEQGRITGPTDRFARDHAGAGVGRGRGGYPRVRRRSNLGARRGRHDPSGPPQPPPHPSVLSQDT